MIPTLKTLCALPGVSGWEDEVRTYISEEIAPFVTEMHTDVMGNLIAFKAGRTRAAQKLLLCAHMDEVGLIVTRIDPDGYLRFGCVGGIDRRVLPGKQVRIGPHRVPGVITTIPWHLENNKKKPPCPAPAELWIDIGARDADDARRAVLEGDVCVFDAPIRQTGDFLRAKAIDDRVGCAAMLCLLRQDLPCDTTFAFTVQEELGTRGATALTSIHAPDVCLVLEGTTATDLPDLPLGKQICHVGEGVVIPFMDGGTLYDRRMVALLQRLADEAHIPWQTKHVIAGGTDGRAVQRSGGGVRTAGIAVAVRNIHSPASIASATECTHLHQLASLFLTAFARSGEI